MESKDVLFGSTGSRAEILYKELGEKNKEIAIQQRWEWGQCIVAVGEDIPIYFVVLEKGECVAGLMSFLLQKETGNLLISNPQAGSYGGIIFSSNNTDEHAFALIIKKFVDYAKAEDCAFATITTAPFERNLELYREFFQPDFEQPNFFQYIDISELQKSPHVPLRYRSKNLRKRIRRAIRSDVKIDFEGTEQDLADWYQVHKSRMVELGVKALPMTLFESINRILVPRQLAFYTYARLNNIIIGGALFIGNGPLFDVYMASSDSEYRELNANSLVVHESLLRVEQMGAKILNWQSSDSKNSSIYQFKSTWGSIENDHYYLTKITGNYSNIAKLTRTELATDYQGHYVAPYSFLES